MSTRPTLFDPGRHESLHPVAWDAEAVHTEIQRIVADTENRFDPARLWAAHPRDRTPAEEASVGLTPLYHGACGVIWALHYLSDRGGTTLQRDYLPFLDAARSHNETWLGEVSDQAAPSYMMGDTPFLLMQWAHAADTGPLEETLAQLMAGNLDHPFRELMWGSPGSLLAALFMHGRTGQPRWADLFVQIASKLWSQLLWSEEFQCHYWQQDLYGRPCTYLDAVHGFVATAFVITKGRHLLAPRDWLEWERCIEETVVRTVSEQDGLANWRAQLLTEPGEKPRLLMQFCHGAPGFVTCLAQFPSSALDALLLRAGEAIWVAGPLIKGANLCHGTGGNGYAFLKLYQRTGNTLWLERARAFAMHGIAQTRADQTRYGHGQYSLWTGDLGFAIYLWDCVRGQPQFPTLDVF